MMSTKMTGDDDDGGGDDKVDVSSQDRTFGID